MGLLAENPTVRIFKIGASLSLRGSFPASLVSHLRYSIWNDRG